MLHHTVHLHGNLTLVSMHSCMLPLFLGRTVLWNSISTHAINHVIRMYVMLLRLQGAAPASQGVLGWRGAQRVHVPTQLLSTYLLHLPK